MPVLLFSLRCLIFSIVDILIKTSRHTIRSIDLKEQITFLMRPEKLLLMSGFRSSTASSHSFSTHKQKMPIIKYGRQFYSVINTHSQRFSAIAQPKLTDLDSRIWLAPTPLYISQFRARLNCGSVSIRLHRHGSGCISDELSLSAPSSIFCQPIASDSLHDQHGPTKRLHDTLVSCTRPASLWRRRRSHFWEQ